MITLTGRSRLPTHSVVLFGLLCCGICGVERFFTQFCDAKACQAMYSIPRNQVGGATRYRPPQQHDMSSTFHAHEMRDAREMAIKTLVVQQEKAGDGETWTRNQATEKLADSSKEEPEKSLGKMNRCKSLFAMSWVEDCSSSIESSASDACSEDSGAGATLPTTTLEVGFVPALRRLTGDSPQAPDFRRSEVRRHMEPHLRGARLQREQSRKTTSHLKCSASIASSMGVPYTALRQERPFLFDEHSYPLHTILAHTLGVQDLRQVHTVPDEKELLKPLLDRAKRHAFHAAYDGFVTSFCIPLLHSMAISKRILELSPSDCITYRYQAFPTIQISRPGDSCISSPTCDLIQGHSVAALSFHIPLTPSEGTNAMFIESHPGKEDWHPLQAKSVGLGYLVDGARCLHFDLENTTRYSRVSLTFRVMIHRGQVQDASLCPVALLGDRFSQPAPAAGGYYDEAVLDARQRHAVVKARKDGVLLDPDPRLGFPFAAA